MSTRLHGEESTLHELLPWYLNGTLPVRQVLAFQLHLDDCEECRSELSRMEPVAEFLQDAVREDAPRRRTRFSPLMATAAAAVLVVGFLAGNLWGGAGSPAAGTPFTVIHPIERAAEVPRVVRESAAAAVTVVFDLDLPAGAAPLEVEVRDESGRTAFVSDRFPSTRVALHVEGERWPDGIYELTARPLEDGESSRRVVRFELVSSSESS